SSGYPGLVSLSNGNYVVASPHWQGERGAVTWGSGTQGGRGVVSEANSLVGASGNDGVGSQVLPLRNGKHVVWNQYWSSGRGAATWGSGTEGVQGVVSEDNSLVGSSPGDQVGYAVPLSNGNYVLNNPFWSAGRGAVTWADGTRPSRGVVSASNSLVGSSPGDKVGIAWAV